MIKFHGLFVALCCLIGPTICQYKSIGPPLQVNEKLFWDSRGDGSLYYADYYSGAVYRYAYGEDRVYSAKTSNPGFLIPISNLANKFLFAYKNTVRVIEWDGKSSAFTRSDEPVVFTGSSESILSGFVTDSKNDWYMGSFTSSYCTKIQNQTIYESLRFGQRATTDHILQSNAGLIMVQNTLYYADSCLKQIFAYDQNPYTGRLGPTRLIMTLDVLATSSILGITADSQGYLYVGVYGEGQILKIDPLISTIVERISVPQLYVASLTFGGPNLDILFVSTSRLPPPTLNVTEPPPAGKVFLIPMKVCGNPTSLPRVGAIKSNSFKSSGTC